MSSCKLWKECSNVGKGCAYCERHDNFTSLSYNNVTICKLLAYILAELERL